MTMEKPNHLKMYLNLLLKMGDFPASYGSFQGYLEFQDT